jgi:hypothetical protein
VDTTLDLQLNNSFFQPVQARISQCLSSNASLNGTTVFLASLAGLSGCRLTIMFRVLSSTPEATTAFITGVVQSNATNARLPLSRVFVPIQWPVAVLQTRGQVPLDSTSPSDAFFRLKLHLETTTSPRPFGVVAALRVSPSPAAFVVSLNISECDGCALGAPSSTHVHVSLPALAGTYTLAFAFADSAAAGAVVAIEAVTLLYSTTPIDAPLWPEQRALSVPWTPQSFTRPLPIVSLRTGSARGTCAPSSPSSPVPVATDEDAILYLNISAIPKSGSTLTVIHLGMPSVENGTIHWVATENVATPKHLLQADFADTGASFNVTWTLETQAQTTHMSLQLAFRLRAFPNTESLLRTVRVSIDFVPSAQASAGEPSIDAYTADTAWALHPPQVEAGARLSLPEKSPFMAGDRFDLDLVFQHAATSIAGMYGLCTRVEASSALQPLPALCIGPGEACERGVVTTPLAPMGGARTHTAAWEICLQGVVSPPYNVTVRQPFQVSHDVLPATNLSIYTIHSTFFTGRNTLKGDPGVLARQVTQQYLAHLEGEEVASSIFRFERGESLSLESGTLYHLAQLRVALAQMPSAPVNVTVAMSPLVSASRNTLASAFFPGVLFSPTSVSLVVDLRNLLNDVAGADESALEDGFEIEIHILDKDATQLHISQASIDTALVPPTLFALDEVDRTRLPWAIGQTAKPSLSVLIVGSDVDSTAEDTAVAHELVMFEVRQTKPSKWRAFAFASVGHEVNLCQSTPQREWYHAFFLSSRSLSLTPSSRSTANSCNPAFPVVLTIFQSRLHWTHFIRLIYASARIRSTSSWCRSAMLYSFRRSLL